MLKGKLNASKLAHIISVVLIFIIIVILIVINPIDKYKRWQYGANRGVTLEGLPVERLLEHELYDIIKRVAPEIEVIPRNAFIERETSRMVPEVQGKKIHTTLTIEKVLKAEPDSWVSMVIIELDPAITVSLLENIVHQIGYYNTYIGGGGGRAENIILGTSLIDNYLIPPGDVFSFNKTLGPITYERGFRYAPIISGGAIVPGLGGGLCQVASTLYNAVLEADLEVVERSPHSRPVGYVPRGRDATVSTYIDFKFRNDTDSYILIDTSTAGYRINVSLLNNKGTT